MANPVVRSKRPVLKPVHTWIGIISGLFLSVIALTGSVIIFRAEFERAALPKSAAVGNPARRVTVDEAARFFRNVTQISDKLLEDRRIQTVEQQVGRAEQGEDPWGPQRAEFHVELKPLPEQTTMPNPCLGVPRNSWCPKSKKEEPPYPVPGSPVA